MLQSGPSRPYGAFPMRLSTRTCLLFMAATLASGGALAANVYKRKDANGVTHSSDKPPAGQPYEVRRVDGQYAAEIPGDEPAAESAACAGARGATRAPPGPPPHRGGRAARPPAPQGGTPRAATHASRAGRLGPAGERDRAPSGRPSQPAAQPNPPPASARRLRGAAAPS